MEEWKNVVGFEEYYKVSNTGRIIRKERLFEAKTNDRKQYKIHIEEKELKFLHDKDGYLKTAFRVDGKRYYRRVHRIVAMAFIPNPENKPVINHKNGIKDDNRVENLEWATVSENTQHGFDVLGRKGNNGGMNKPCASIDPITMKIVKEYNSIQEASDDMGVHIASVSQAINTKTKHNKRRKCKKLYWEFIDKGQTTIEKWAYCREDN